MKPELHERLMRILVSAVLNSDLTASELRKVCKELVYDPETLRDFSRILSGLADGLFNLDGAKEFNKSPKFEAAPMSKSDDRTNFLVGRLKRSKLPKARINELMSEMSPYISPSMSSTLTLYQMVINFLREASDEQVNKLLSMVESAPLEDDYLRGMSERQLDVDR